MPPAGRLRLRCTGWHSFLADHATRTTSRTSCGWTSSGAVEVGREPSEHGRGAARVAVCSLPRRGGWRGELLGRRLLLRRQADAGLGHLVGDLVGRAASRRSERSRTSSRVCIRRSSLLVHPGRVEGLAAVEGADLAGHVDDAAAVDDVVGRVEDAVLEERAARRRGRPAGCWRRRRSPWPSAAAGCRR